MAKKEKQSAGAISRRIQSQIQTLRNQGHVVNIYHVRCFVLKTSPGGETVCEYMTHKQYNKTYDPHKFIADVSPIGGYTEIEIKKDDVVIARGKFNQNVTNVTSFNRRIGYQAAWGRAVKQLLGRPMLRALKAGEVNIL